MGREVLGKGLGALLQGGGGRGDEIVNVDINLIVANELQPRKSFNVEKLKELSRSIKEQGVLQPVLLRLLEYNKYELIAGERRLRASKLAGLKNIPSIIKDIEGVNRLELALIENLQREDLNAIEEGASYKYILNHLNITQEELGKRLGRSRASISNTMRLLKLPLEVQELIIAGKLTEGHGRALLGLSDYKNILSVKDYFLRNGVSVREAERIVDRVNREGVLEFTRGNEKSSEKSSEKKEVLLAEGLKTNLEKVRGIEEAALVDVGLGEEGLDGDEEAKKEGQKLINALEGLIKEYFIKKDLEANVRITKGRGTLPSKGKIEISYNSNTELKAILKAIGLDLE